MAASIGGQIMPSRPGGEKTAISGTPANLARVAVITTVDTKGTLPAGT